MSQAQSARLEARREALFARLDSFYEGFTKWHTRHDRTEYRCMQSGKCCQIGLESHYMECENIARHLEKRFAEDPGSRDVVIGKLKEAFFDEAWKPSSIIGDKHCAFYDNGCTIYPFRPAVCRLYGVAMEIDDFCPRERLASGNPMLFVSKEVDGLIRHYYATLDAYGRLHPDRDYTVFMPRGVLSFLLSKQELTEFRRTTKPRFWRRHEGYRTNYRPSYRMGKEQVEASKLTLRLVTRRAASP